MDWSLLTWGEHKGKSLPQIIFTDPDWFFFTTEKGYFDNKGKKLLSEAKEVYYKACHIRIPQKGLIPLVAEYIIHKPTGKFGEMRIVPSDQPEHRGSSQTIRLSCIDMYIPRKVAPYDKFGYKVLISNIKKYLFNDRSYKMTKKRCEDFFSDHSNFDLSDKKQQS
jgi:hypothetical protein